MPAISAPVYLDHAATTPVRPEVATAMQLALEDNFGNPSSAHAWGRRARILLEEARSTLAHAIGTSPECVVFVRGGTESNNLAVLGRARYDAARGARAHVITSAIEHPSVFEAARRVAAEGGRHTVVGFSGLDLDVGALAKALRQRASVASFIWVDNETGLELPIGEVGEMCRDHGVQLHSDSVQAVGKLAVEVDDLSLDMLTLTGHKVYGPKGAGALLVRERGALEPLHFGGGQERGLRPGTEDVVGAVGLAEAVRLAVGEQRSEAGRLKRLRDRVEAAVLAVVPGARAIAGEVPRAPHISSLRIPGADSDVLLAALDQVGVAASAGSACASGSGGRSRAVEALHPDDSGAVVRLSFGRLNAARAGERIAELVVGAAERARALGAAGNPRRHGQGR